MKAKKMNLKKLIGRKVVRTKPRDLPGGSEGYWDFSFLTSPIEIVDVGTQYIFYKSVYAPNSWMHKEPRMWDLIHKIDTLRISDNDGFWVEFNPADQEKYLANENKWREYYEKTYPEQIQAMRAAW
jgi:hypothetical protein